MTERRVYKVEFLITDECDKYIVVDDLSREYDKNDYYGNSDSLGWRLEDVKKETNSRWGVTGEITKVEQISKEKVLAPNSSIPYRIKLGYYELQQIQNDELFVCRIQYTLTYSFSRTVYAYSKEEAINIIQKRFGNNAIVASVKDIQEEFIQKYVSYWSVKENEEYESRMVDEYEDLDDEDGDFNDD